MENEPPSNSNVVRGKSRDRQPIRTAEKRVMNNFQRNRNVVIGKKPSSGVMSWSGADLTVESYIGRVAFSVDAEMIKTDLTSKGYDVISIEENETRHQRFKSFKLVVKQTDFEKLLSFPWPERTRRSRTPSSAKR